MQELKIRVNNSNLELVGKLWDDFMSGVFDSSRGKVFGIYTNYESDENGDYDLTITQNLSKYDLKNKKYKKYKVEGELPMAVYETWQNIWKDDIDRRFDLDYEEYDFSKEKPEAIVYISVK